MVWTGHMAPGSWRTIAERHCWVSEVVRLREGEHKEWKENDGTFKALQWRRRWCWITLWFGFSVVHGSTNWSQRPASAINTQLPHCASRNGYQQQAPPDQVDGLMMCAAGFTSDWRVVSMTRCCVFPLEDSSVGTQASKGHNLFFWKVLRYDDMKLFKKKIHKSMCAKNIFFKIYFI